MTGRDPYCLYHDLDDRFVPVEGGEPLPPPFPSRRQAVLFAFGNHEFEFRAKLAGAKVTDKRKQAPRGRQA